MIHARDDYNRIQDPALRDPSLLAPGSTPIGEDEPVLLIRAKDKFAPAAVRGYVNLVREARREIEFGENEPTPDEQKVADALRDIDLILAEHADIMQEWQEANGCKLPDVPHWRQTPKLQKVTIYGASDDLIEIEGDLVEEFNPQQYPQKEPVYLAFGDGTVLSAMYGEGGEGFWRVNRIRVGTASYKKTEATDEDHDYSDRVTLEGNLCWVVKGNQIEKIGK